jgi:ligand-binding sensor domain-containing protein
MAHDVVAGIAMAPDGDLWCTHPVEGGGGISHFDGANWTHYTAEDGLASNKLLWFQTLAVTPDGVLWAGTFDSGVSRFDGETWTTYTTEHGLCSDTTYAVALAPNGDLWCAGPGLSRFDGENWTVYLATETGLTYPGAVSIAATLDGSVWAGGIGLSSFDGESWTSYGDDHGLVKGPVGSIATTQGGSIWAGGDGVSLFDGGSWTHFSCVEMGLTEESELCVTSLATDLDGDLWAGTGDQGVFHYDGEIWTNYSERDGLIDDSVFSIAVAPDGALWFGTNGGLSRFSPE